MARGDQELYNINWDEFGQRVVKDWQGRMLDKDIFDTGHLYRSIEYGYRTVNAMNQTVGRGGSSMPTQIPDQFTFVFPMYGIYVEKGVGRGCTRGNGGNLIKFKERGRGRQRRSWYSGVFVHERRRLAELVRDTYGYAAMESIRSIEANRIYTR